MVVGAIFTSCWQRRGQWLIAAIDIMTPVILIRAVVSATSQSSLTLPVLIAVPFPFLTEVILLAAEGIIIAEASCFLSAGIQISIAQEV